MGRQWTKAILGVGFASLLLGLLAAIRSPATSYELSIYAATPDLFWAGVAGASLASVGVIAGRPPRRIRQGAALLLAVVITTIGGLPLVRGYNYYGAGDSLTHLGSARTFAQGLASPIELLYPGSHLVAIFLDGFGPDLRWALMVTFLAFSLAFVVFVPLSAGVIGGKRALVLGVPTAALLLPVNNVSVHLGVHPVSEAILLFPLAIYVMFRYLTATERPSTLRVTSTGLVVAVVSAGTVLIHPQQALNVVLLFAMVAGIQYVYRRMEPDHQIANHRPLYAQTGFIALWFLAWTLRHERVYAAGGSVLNGLLGTARIGAEIGQRGTSLAQIGGSVEELFVKLFLPAAIYSALVAAFVVAHVTGRVDETFFERESLVTYLVAGAVPLVALFITVFSASYTTQHFRYVGVVMVFASVIGAVALAYGVDRLERVVRPSAVHAGTVAVVLVLLTLTVWSLHPSPYYYRSNPMVPEARMDGYESAFDVRDPDVGFAGIRSGPRRYVDAIYGTERPDANTFPGRRTSVPPPVFNNGTVSSYYDGQRYVVLESVDEPRELDVYRGLRYTGSGFDALDASAGIDRVQTNGDVALYLATGRNRSATP